MTRTQTPAWVNRSVNAALPMASLAMAIASASYVPHVSAQDDLRVLEEVVVTARRREENLQEVPVAVSALGADFLREENVVELNDLGTKVPSFRVSTGGSSTNEPVLSIRGQRPTDSTLGLDAAIPIYFNEVVMTPTQGTNMAMYDLENVQVLKGPQGTLFGRNSTGGALLMTAKKPGYDQEGYIEGKIGNYNMRSLEGGVTVPVNDNLQMRFSGRMLKRDGYQENVANNGVDDPWDENSKGGRVGINYENGAFSNLLTVGYDKNDMLARAVVPDAYNYSTLLNKFFLVPTYGSDAIQAAVDRAKNRDADQVETDVEAPEEITNTVVSNVTEFEINDDLTIKNVFGYRNMEWNRTNDADGTAFGLYGAITGATGVPVFPSSSELITTDAEQFSNELQLVGSAFDGDLDWILGGYYYQMEGSQEGIVQVLGTNGTGIYQSAPNGDVKNTATGIFAEGTYHIDEEWSVTAGLRQSWDKREVTAKNLFSGNVPISSSEALAGNVACGMIDSDGSTPTPCERTESKSFKKPTGRVSVNWTPVDGHLLYGSVATGYRAGGFNLRGTSDTSLKPFEEETVITYELGHKADWYIADVPVRTNTAIYTQNYKNIQKTVSDTDSAFGTKTVNAGEATINGIEFDITASVTDNLTLNFAYSYVDASYDDFELDVLYRGIPLDAAAAEAAGFEVSGISATGTVDLSKGQFGYIPKQTLTASANYVLPVDASLGEMSVGASVYWQDEMSTDPFEPVLDLQADIENWAAADLAAAKSATTVSSYTLLNLRYDWRNVMGSEFDFAAWVNNATDEQYVVGGLNVITSLGFAGNTYGAPRTIGASVRYSF